MERISRSKLRGMPLDLACEMARTITEEIKANGKRDFCYGIYEIMTKSLDEVCERCGAYIGNAKSLKEV